MGRCYKRAFDLAPFYAFINFISSAYDKVTITNRGRSEVIELDEEGELKYKCLRLGEYIVSSEAQGATDRIVISHKGQTYISKLILNTHAVLSAFPHYILGQFTHDELRELLIQNNISPKCKNLAHYPCSRLQGINISHLSNYGMRYVND